MQFHLAFSIPKADFSIEYGQQILSFGSCFSNEIAQKLHDTGFKINSNPTGVIFHPIPLARFIEECITPPANERVLERDNAFYSFDGNTLLNGKTETDLTEKLTFIRKQVKEQLKNASVLFITFGTAWGYRELEQNTIVANCQKLPNNRFIKELTSIENIFTTWTTTLTKIQSFNPNLKVVFTVSPVKHTRDGIIENVRSKSILIEGVHQLCEHHLNVSYFPAFEIIQEELRDYRFYKSDLVHPSEQAITYVWEKFQSTYLQEATQLTARKVHQLNKRLTHQIQNSNQEAENFIEQTKLEIEALLNENPLVILKQL